MNEHQANLQPPLEIKFSSAQGLLDQFKRIVLKSREQLNQLFLASPDSVDTLIKNRSSVMDDLLRLSWQHFFSTIDSKLTLIAAGGYGREELLPYSDIDLLILTDEQTIEKHKDKLEAFITFLWDTNLEIGHSVRTCEECITQAKDDLSTATNLLESRFICGDTLLFDDLLGLITSDQIFTSEDFFKAKIDEQNTRHDKLGSTKFSLEPNVKNSPGGLRDIQTIGWIIKHHFDNQAPGEFNQNNFLTEEDMEILNQGQTFLFKIRFALHMQTLRKEDRLLFEFQQSIAEILGYEDNENALAIEQMMKQYYRWVLALSELNEMFLQLFDELMFQDDQTLTTVKLNSRFSATNHLIESHDESLFIKEPSALLEIFLLISQHPQITGVKAATIRQIRDHRHVIDDAYRQSNQNKSLFLQILQAPYRVASTIELMLRYGILGKFLPSFGQIIGQTQLDLFHIYTVDAHTMMVLKNMHSFTNTNNETYPLATKVIAGIAKKELLYLACLFHDIAKGRGGDHSMLGSAEAYDFCRSLGINNRDSKLVSWLVKYHLYMSRTAQKKDLSDPEVIKQFATRMGDQRHLDFLFLLTVADINGTNPSLWNSWRAALIYQLYKDTRSALRRGLENTVDKQELIQENQQTALEQLKGLNCKKEDIFHLWNQAGDDYFLRETTHDIVWHTETILNQPNNHGPLVLIRNTTPYQGHQSVTQLFIYTPDKMHTFAKVTAFLEQQSLSIVGAKVYSSLSGYTLDTFLIIDHEGQPLDLTNSLDQHLCQQLKEILEDSENTYNPIQMRTSRQLKFFNLPTQTHFSNNLDKGFSILEVITADRPGLLALIGELFFEFDIQLIDAKIATLGERVEDIFYITDIQGNPITDITTARSLQDRIRERLDQEVAKTS